MLSVKFTCGINTSVGVSTSIMHISIFLTWVVVVMRLPTRDSLAPYGCNILALRLEEGNSSLQVNSRVLVSDGSQVPFQVIDMFIETFIFTFLSVFNIVDV